MSLLLSFLAMIGLLFVIDQSLWFYVILIYGVSAFLSKYYTAAPFKFGYRGIGEMLIWFSFGPMAIMLAGFSQNMMMQETFYAVMPATGFSTLTILWIGQLIDLPDDKSAGKIGLVIRMGTKRASYGYLIIQSLLMLNILVLVFFIFHPGWPLLLALIPFVVLLPKIWTLLKKYHADPMQLVPVATLNTVLYVLFSLFFILGLWLHPSLKIFPPVDEIVYQDQCNRLIPIFSTSNFSIAGMKPGSTKGGYVRIPSPFPKLIIMGSFRGL